MTSAIGRDRRPFLLPPPNTCTGYRVLQGFGAAILAAKPAGWLIETWRDPVYASHGAVIALAVAGLAGWSLASGPPRIRGAARAPAALALLAGTALIRLAGQVLGIHIIGALALVVDVYALGLLLRLPCRPRPLDPAWLAVLFGFSLPLERVLQRSVGFGLQQLSADGACRLLDTVAGSVSCQGTRILLNGTDVLVDLPCSGAQGLLLLLTLFAAAAAVTRPTPLRAAVGLVVTLAAALGANILRISALAIGIADPDAIGGVSEMAPPWHDAIGLAALAIGAAPVLAWASVVPAAGHGRPEDSAARTPSDGPRTPSDRPRATRFVRRLGPRPAALLFVIGAAVIVSLPARPIDVARRSDPPALPARLDGYRAVPDPLSEREAAYFTRYGGGAARAAYGPYGLMLVRTNAPLRHLHAPDECLTGAGHTVRFVTTLHDGFRSGLPPAAVYHSTAPDGRAYTILISFVSDRGETVPSVAEAVWRWLQAPGSQWTQVQRIVPADLPLSAVARWETAVAASLDLPGGRPPAPVRTRAPEPAAS